MTTNENQELQQEEFVALSSIFGEEAFQLDTFSSEPYLAYTFKLSLENNVILPEEKSNITEQDRNFINKSSREFTLRFHFPPEYPSSEPPSYEIKSLYCGTLKIDQSIKDDIEKNFKRLFIPGEVVIFSWIEWLQDFMINKLKIYENEDATLKNMIQSEHQIIEIVHFANVANTEEQLNEEKIECPQITHGDQFEHKKSIFVAHLASVYNLQQVKLVRSTLLLDKKIAKASHNIMAYRIVQENGIILQDNDDDGETAAGGRLLHLLQLVDAKNVIVIVSRWFGGILLGPERFKDIQNCARDLLEKCGYITNSNEQKSSGRNKKKRP
ncbi:protein IMPACT [Rhizophagus irregularis DAOM 181602=DAOM 197198]|uniref:Ribosomal protein S5 domain 2-type protein n=2 Tax=Rhizophagus irregularis TaxID=588596 RepID=U9TIF8_RHIID|nr:ribosomal protein S5 domain 2-type protein [Rhizophagus irregularis DAOM 181602=DAOM 197198]POG80127.1 ribosomal protein S5 domain 2-type protein [Rhizophagus irregularis DAOM 181602=DAOM 197198]GBC41633.2 protein IMPACT [Rhizophagus irregularis DAOM 181602=DAOM 197198]CAG8505512.1 2655_t:CDS:2 [Rhizophagus irregularis]|eukprot:XP_025186993.1 ribosomal protein S5 domain 2-type protein [Rhizophagus irregularis DAOM 181602=DAOM 197198]